MGSSGTSVPSLRWGVLGTGWISSMFLQDLLAARPAPKAEHKIVAIGSSSLDKGNAFVDKLWANTTKSPAGSEPSRPTVYANYQGVYDDPDVDIVYVGTPHSLHKQNCLDAIAAGKHVLCEKPLTINEKEAQEVVTAARAKGVFLMEALWVRFVPIFDALRSEILERGSIGQVQRFFMDFGNKMPLDALPANSRLKDVSLGAGALLDIGVYTLTYASLIMGEFKVGKQHPQPKRLTSSLAIANGMDESSVVVLDYEQTTPTTNQPAGGQPVVRTKTAICTSTFHYRGGQDFAHIQGSDGEIVIFGPVGSVPMGYRVKSGPQPTGLGEPDTREERVYNVEKPAGTLGFFWEADAVAHDIANGRTENATMPLDESLRMMALMDEIRAQGGLRYPQDET